MAGRYDGDETDATASQRRRPQLWDVEVAGTGIGQLDFTRRDGAELATGEVNADQTRRGFPTPHLTPGDHWLRMNGENGDYTITLNRSARRSGRRARDEQYGCNRRRADAGRGYEDPAGWSRPPMSDTVPLFAGRPSSTSSRSMRQMTAW